MTCHHRSDCRACGSTDLAEILDLGPQPPANAFLMRDEFDSEKYYPLKLYFCRGCALVQLLHVVDPGVLFNKTYAYKTSTSQPMVEHFKRYAHENVVPLISSPTDRVVDIGGNDGLLLSFLKGRCYTINIDPAATSEPRDPVLFTRKVAEYHHEHYPAPKVIVANNVLAHVDNVRDFLLGVGLLLADDGVFICEVHWARDLIDRGCFDCIYHEHLCYWSLTSLMKLMNNVGLEVYDVKVFSTHGQSVRVFAKKRDHTKQSIRRMFVEHVLEREWDKGVINEEAWHDFAARVEAKRRVLRELITDLNDASAVIVGYGAPAKGNTLLNYVGYPPDYLIDTTPEKQGKYSPGMHVEVEPAVRSSMPDYALLLAWNYKDAILEKEKDLRAKGMKFIVPFPEVTIV
jgi:D-mycarose 3-C-methyltransferase